MTTGAKRRFDPNEVRHPGAHWSEVIEEAGDTPGAVSRRTKIAGPRLTEILNQKALPTASETLALSHDLRVSARLMWHLQADYTLSISDR